MSTPSAHLGALSLIDDVRAVLLADLESACTTIGGLVADYTVTAPEDRNILCAEPRIPGQGSALVAYGAGLLYPEQSSNPGRRLEVYALLVNCTHHQQRLTTSPSTGTPEAATLEHESWRIAAGLARAVELALCQNTGLTSKTGIYSIDSQGQQRQPADPGNPAQFTVTLTLHVHMEVYDPLHMSPP